MRKVPPLRRLSGGTETVEKGTSAFFEKRLHGGRDSISFEIVAPPAMRSVISEAHVLGNDGS